MNESNTARQAVERGLVWAGDFAWQNALQEFERAVSLAPDLASGYRHRGVALYKLGRRQEAVETLDAALRLNPGEPGALVDRAAVQLGNWKIANMFQLMPGNELGEAIRDVGSAVAIDPGYTPGQFVRFLAGEMFATFRLDFDHDSDQMPAIMVGQSDLAGLLARADVASVLADMPLDGRGWLAELLKKCPEEHWGGVLCWCDGLQDPEVLAAVGAEAAARRWWPDAVWAYTEVVRMNEEDSAGHHALASALFNERGPGPDGRRLSLALDHAVRACSLDGWRNRTYRDNLRQITDLREAQRHRDEFEGAGPTKLQPRDGVDDERGQLDRGAATDPSTS